MRKFALLTVFILFTIIGRSETLQNYLIPTPQRVDIQNNEALVWDEYQFSQLSNYLAQFNLSNWETQSFFAGMGGPVIKLSMQQDPKYPSQEYRLLVLPDHPTPIRVRTHTSDPVPYLLYDSTSQQSHHWKYNEREAKTSGNYRPQGHEMMRYLLR